MKNQEPDNRDADELLERAIASCREQADIAVSSHPEPAPHVTQQTLMRLAAQSQASVPTRSIWRSILMQPKFQFSAAALVAASVLGAIWLFAFKPGVTFADVVANVAAVHSVWFRSITVEKTPGFETQQIISETLIVGPSLSRRVNQTDGMIQIFDYKAGKGLMLNPKSKTAVLPLLFNMSKKTFETNLLEQIAKCDPKEFMRIGEKDFNGRAAFQYKSVNPNHPWQQIVWVDKQTLLPVKIEMTITAVTDSALTTVMSDFKWDPPFDPASLSLVPPPGYQVVTGPFPVVQSTEKDLLLALRTMAQSNNNLFPPHFWHDHPLLQATEKAKVIGHGVWFTQEPSNGSDWHYAGNGVAFGRPHTPIMWYQPKGANSYRVIDADLTVHEAKADEVSKIPSEDKPPPLQIRIYTK